MPVQFNLNGVLCVEDGLPPTTSVLDYLRQHKGKTGTKEGCAEGDCGACTIVLAREDESGTAIYEAVNSCLLMLPQLDGANVVTVEGIADADTLDPVQAAMVETDGTQCGFCTPGFIMALYALRQGGEEPTDEVIHEALAGNLCRCTGYTPIVAAAKKACGNAPPDVVGAHATLVPSSSYATENQRFHAPNSLEDLAALRAAHPSAHLLAGGTDLGILTSKERQPLPEIISTVHVEELLEITETDDYLELGAAVTYTRALPYIKRLYPSLATLITRIGSRQIRNVGTFGGNIGTASPIGDTLPCLIALDATVILHSLSGERSVPLEDFFIGYRETCLGSSEFIKAIHIPKLPSGQAFRAYKISKRYDQDISSVIGAYRVGILHNKVASIRVAFGGMAATPKRASASEAALAGKAWTEETVLAVSTAVAEDFTPLSDHRASQAYRLRVAENLFVRLYRDLSEFEDLTDVVAA